MPANRSVPIAVLLTFIAYLAPLKLSAEIPPPTNELFGFVTQDMTLTLASPGPTYFVLGDLVVNPGVTLTIEPGVTLEFTANTDILGGGDFINKGEISVKGVLSAIGSGSDSIRFVSSDFGSNEWGQIRVESGGSADFEYVVILGAVNGINSFSSITVRHSELSNYSGGTGIIAHQASTISDCRLSGYSMGLTLSASGTIVEKSSVIDVLSGLFAGSITIQECVFRGIGTSSTGIGIELTGSSDTSPVDSLIPSPTLVSNFKDGVLLRTSASARNIVSFENEIGIHGTSSNNLVYYCTAAENTGRGIWLNSGGPVLNSISALNGGTGIRIEFNGFIDFTDSWSNGAGDFAGGVLGQQTASFNPFFVDPSSDNYRLEDNSIFKTFSNSEGEIGAYGPGPGPPTSVPPRNPPETVTWGRIKAERR